MKHIFLLLFFCTTITTFAQCNICFKTNVTQDQLSVTAGTNENIDIVIYDLNGNLKFEAKNTVHITFDTSTLSKGVYIVMVSNTKGQVETKKIVIKK